MENSETPQHLPENEPNKSSGKPSDSENTVHKEALKTIGVLLSALVLAFGLITFVFQTYQVSGTSMEQTLHNGDRMLVWKMPRTWARITGHGYVPARGDVIILSEPAAKTACESDGGTQLVKRVVGLPGDRVVVANGKLAIYNKQHPHGFSPDTSLPYHNQITETTKGNVDVRLSSNQIFVSGDNRTVSCDSRVFGPVNLNQVIGKVVLRVLPVSQFEVF